MIRTAPALCRATARPHCTGSPGTAPHSTRWIGSGSSRSARSIQATGQHRSNGSWVASRQLATAAADPEIARAPVTLVVTGIPWRTTWKYGERGFRPLYWDAGTMLANLLTLDPSASVRLGFADDAVGRLVDIDGVSEYPLVLAVLPDSDANPVARAVEGTGAVAPLGLAIEPISCAPIEFPLVAAAQRDGDLADSTAVDQWRAAANRLGADATGLVEPPPDAAEDPIEAVILRHGSTRLMRPEPVQRELLRRNSCW